MGRSPTLHALGVGSNSTSLNRLQDSGRISARVWSIYWGRFWTKDNLIDGSLVLGGYDESKIVGQNHTQALDYTSIGCWTGMEANIADIVLNFPDGSDSSLLPPNTAISACIVPQEQLLLAASPGLMDIFENQTGTTAIGYSLGWLQLGSGIYARGTEYDGDISIFLDNGLTIRVPNDQFVVPRVDWFANGATISNDSHKVVLIGSADTEPATLGRAFLGRHFLTAAYLMVDQDAQTFTLWQANPTKSTNLVPVLSQSKSGTCDNTTAGGSSAGSTSAALPPNSHSPAALIAGLVVGLSILLAFCGLGFFGFWKRLGRNVKSQSPFPVSEAPPDFRKFELHNNSASQTTSVSLTDHITQSSQRWSDTGGLCQASMLQPQDRYRNTPVYEISSAAPLIDSYRREQLRA